MMSYWFIKVQELVHYGAVVHMVGDGAETVILRDSGKIVLAIILSQRFVVPHDAFLYTFERRTYEDS